MQKELITWLLAQLKRIIDSHLDDILAWISANAWHLKPRVGIYEVLEHNVTLELKKIEGTKATYSKYQKVRFLQDNIVAYLDKAWGDGDIFGNYRCTPGYHVDRYQEGYYFYNLISLRQIKSRGDIEEFHIQRTIKNGFISDKEYLQTDIDHRTHLVKVTILFPKARPPRHVTLTERNAKRTRRLHSEHINTLPNGKHELTWRMRNPRLYEGYILTWKW